MRTRLLAAVLAPLMLMVTAVVALDPPEPAPVEVATARASSEPVTYRAAPPASTPVPSMVDAPVTTTTTVAPAPPAPAPRPRPRPAPAVTDAPVAPAAPAYSGGGSGDPYDMASWDRLAQCESGGNWSINTGNSYYGGIQFSLSSWRGVGGQGYPHENSRAEQIHRGQLLWEQGGWTHWPGCTRSFGWR